MDMYALKNGKLSLIDSVDFKLEKDIQKLCEDNLPSLFGLKTVKSEFILQNLRIDTLAFDSKSKSFVVIEYKKDKNFSVIDQGYAYLSLVLNNKADCILEYNEANSTPLKKGDIDWSQTRVLFIAPSFTVYQVQSINFKDLPIEIWEIKRFANDTISLAQIQPAGSVETVKTISSKSKTIQGVSKEIKVYTEEDHLKTSNEEVKELYQQLKEALLGFSHKVRVKPTKKYIGFIAKTNFVDVRPQKKALKIWFNLKKGELDDPKDLVRDMSSTGHWGNGEYEVHISDDSNLEYILSLAKQALKRNS